MSAIRRRRRRRPGSQRGDSLLEFALMSAVFFMTIFGVTEFGRAIFDYNVVANAARDGARWAIVRGYTSSSPADEVAVKTYVRTRVYGMNANVTTTWSPDNKPGGVVSVTVSTNFTPLTSYIPIGTIAIRSTAQMVITR